MGLILASKSPRRRQLMALITPHFTVEVAGVDEALITAQTPPLLAQKLAMAKARAVRPRHPGDIVIGCDTVVEVDGQTLGKPADSAEAAAMLRQLAGKWHLVHTGVCVFAPGALQPLLFCEASRVEFAPLEEKEIAAYIATGEPYDKAGGYGVQGPAACFVRRIEGCYYNVMGLPVAALYKTLRGLGLPLLPAAAAKENDV